MKNGLVWKILLFVGICPFLAPFVGYLYQMMIQTGWTLFDWLILYSYVFWPTYLVGLVLIALSSSKLIR